MTRRFRWELPLGDATVTVTRIVGDHELAEGDRQRRYTLSVQGDSSAGNLAVTLLSDAADCEGTPVGEQSVTIHEGAGLARVRLEFDHERTLLRLPGPSFDDRLAAALDGDREACGQLCDELGTPFAAVLACGPFLDVAGFVRLVDTLAASRGSASDTLHAARYDLVRIAATTACGPAVKSTDQFEALVEGLDSVAAIGDVDPIDAVADLVAVAHDSAGETRAFLEALGYDLSTLVDREDGRFFAAYLAQVARTAGVHDAKQQATRRATATDHPDFEDAKATAERADYWSRDDAWRTALLPAAGESSTTFAYALANALYWTGEVGRSDARIDELCYEGAAAAAATIDLDWVVGHADYERHRAAAHRHRSARNHALALSEFAAARETACQYSFLDAWEPTYSAAIVRSNQLSAAGDHERAVAVLDEGLEELRAQSVPESRFAEMRAHLVGQRHERRAKLAADPDDRLGHLEAALEQYERVGFERSVARIEGKLDRAGERTATDTSTERQAELGPKPMLVSGGDSGPDIEDIPDLHDFLTDADPSAVGSADPGVLPSEQHGDFENSGRPNQDSGPRYR